jgi:5-methylcytosine-specific restriction enzyme subunit McrC
MESVYESYVAQQMKKVFCPDGWAVSSQDKEYYLFTEPKKQFAIRPDIVIKKDGCTVVLDTKWKRLCNNARINYGISQADMYQMYAYSKKYKASDIWVLYPKTMEMNNETDYSFESNTPEGENTKIHLFFVNMGENKTIDSMRELFERIC